jgi:hypothetical protein
MNKKIIILLCFFVVSCNSTKNSGFKFGGNTNYTRNTEESLNSKFNLEYRTRIKQIKIYPIYLSGKITTDHNHFKNETKHNVFTTLGFDF